MLVCLFVYIIRKGTSLTSGIRAAAEDMATETSPELEGVMFSLMCLTPLLIGMAQIAVWRLTSLSVHREPRVGPGLASNYDA